jgi:hypothetical protein
VGVLIIVGLLLSAGDNHACVQSGPCLGCLHAPVSILTVSVTGEVPFIKLGPVVAPTTPHLPPFLPLPQTSLRAPPAVI